MNHRMNFFAAVACVAVLTGCDWGGVSDDESWNDAYSWLNFSDTYTLSDPANFENAAPEGGLVDKGTVHGYGDGNMTSYSSSIPSLGGRIGDGVVPGSVVVIATTEVATGNEELNYDSVMTFSDNGKGGLVVAKGTGEGGTIEYSTGAFSINTGSNPIKGKISVTYSCYGKSTGLDGVYSVTFLHVSQKGNLFTMTDSNGTTFSGRITGASLPKDNYETGKDVRIAFDVSSGAGDKIVGNFTGTWSGAPSGTSGSLSKRMMSGTYYHAGEHKDFHGVASTETVKATPPAEPPVAGGDVNITVNNK